jgi:hypothetical protein
MDMPQTPQTPQTIPFLFLFLANFRTVATKQFRFFIKKFKLEKNCEKFGKIPQNLETTKLKKKKSAYAT